MQSRFVKLVVLFCAAYCIVVAIMYFLSDDPGGFYASVPSKLTTVALGLMLIALATSSNLTGQTGLKRFLIVVGLLGTLLAVLRLTT